MWFYLEPGFDAPTKMTWGSGKILKAHIEFIHIPIKDLAKEILDYEKDREFKSIKRHICLHSGYAKMTQGMKTIAEQYAYYGINFEQPPKNKRQIKRIRQMAELQRRTHKCDHAGG